MNKLLCNFKDRFWGIIKMPTVTLGSLMNDKKWQFMLAFLLIAAFIMGFFTGPIMFKLNFEANPELYPSFSGSIGLVGQILMALTSVFFYLIRLVFVAFFIYLFYSVFGAEGLFVNYFSLVVNASLITIFIPELFQSVYMIITGNVLNIFNFGIFIEAAKRSNLLYFTLSSLDFFQIWFVFLVALGVYGFYKKNSEKWEEQTFSKKKSFVIAIIYFLFKSIVVILFAYLVSKLNVIAQQMLINN